MFFSELNTFITEYAPPPKTPDPDKKPRGILIVDDNEMIRTVMGLFLRQQGVQFWLAASGSDALETYRRNKNDIGLVLLDVQMPDGDGPWTLRELNAVNPNLVCYFMSGDWAPYTQDELLDLGAAGLIVKPLLFKVLTQIVQQCFASA